MKRRLFCISMLGFFFMQCSYHFYAVKDELPGGVRKVAIPTFENNTHEAGIETVFTSALRTEFYKSKTIQVVEKEAADGIIIGRIRSIGFQPTAHSERTFGGRDTKILALEYDVNVSAEITLIRRSDQKVVWTRTLSDARRYQSTEDLLQNETRQREAYAKVAAYLMEQAHDTLFEDF